MDKTDILCFFLLRGAAVWYNEQNPGKGKMT